jgi:hypothetical protein
MHKQTNTEKPHQNSSSPPGSQTLKQNQLSFREFTMIEADDDELKNLADALGGSSSTEETVPLVLVGDAERVERGFGGGGFHFGSTEI